MTPVVLDGAACNRVEGFVRDALGCSCPPEVFGDIRLETGPAGFPEAWDSSVFRCSTSRGAGM